MRLILQCFRAGSFGAFFYLCTAVFAADHPTTVGQHAAGAPDQPPTLIKRVQPLYPFVQAQARLGAAVVVEFVITPTGDVQNPVVVESNNPAFERPALDAVLLWKFTPGRQGGVPVFVRASQRIEFSIPGSEDFIRWRINKGKHHATLPPELLWDVAPVPVNTAFPIYPFEAITARRRGKTVVSFIVGTDGRPVNATVLEATTPAMGLAAVAAVEAWRFTPAKKKDGTACFAALALTHDFVPSGDGDVPVAEGAHRILRLLEKQPEMIVPAGELDRIPQPVSRRAPVYPPALKSAGKTGEAVVEFFIDPQGDAQLPHIVSSSETAFGYAAAQAVSTWRFEPVLKNGKKVTTLVRIPVAFNLDRPPAAPSP